MIRQLQRFDADRRKSPRVSRRAGLVCVVAVALLLAACVSQALASTPLPRVSGLHMASATTGWAVTKTQLLRTTDGGRTWRDVTPGAATGTPIASAITPKSGLGGLPTDLAVRGSSAAWLVVPVDHGVKVFATTDRAAHWRSATITMPASPLVLLGTDFVDLKHGWLAVNLGGGAAGSMDVEVYATSNGGTSWQLASGAAVYAKGHGRTPLGGWKTGLAFSTARHGWLSGGSNANGVWLYASTTAGRSWHAVTLAAPAAGPLLKGMLAGFPTTLPPWFVSHRLGFLPVVGDSGSTHLVDFFTTTNGGTTWTTTQPVVSRAGGLRFWGWTNGRHGFFVNSRKLEFTSNGGRSWFARSRPRKLDGLTQVDFGSTQVGWAPVKGALFKTTNRGRTWFRMNATLKP